MRRVVYLVASSLDGFIADPNGGFDCFVAEGDHVQHYLEMLHSYEAVLMGRKTYQVGLRFGVTNPYPWLRSYVFSRTMPESPDPAVTLIGTDPPEFVRTLKREEGGDVYLCGGGELAAQLLEAGLIDEIAVKLNPLLIGQGIPIFARVAKPVQLKYLGCREYNSGVVLLRYKPGN